MRAKNANQLRRYVVIFPARDAHGWRFEGMGAIPTVKMGGAREFLYFTPQKGGPNDPAGCNVGFWHDDQTVRARTKF